MGVNLEAQCTFVYLPFLLIASLVLGMEAHWCRDFDCFGPAVAQASGTHLVGNQYIFLKLGE